MSKFSIREVILILIIIFMATASIYAYFNPVVKQAKPDEYYYPVEVPKIYKVISKVTVTVTEIKVITKTEIKEKWPAWFTDDTTKQLTAIGLVDPYKGKTECASIIDTRTGNSFIAVKRLPVPFLGFENTIRVGGITGIGTELHANWTFARIGIAYVTTGVASISNGENQAYAAGIGFDLEF